jgi:hypothetical protein
VLKQSTWRDVLVAILFAFVALAFQLQRWGGYDPAIFMHNDAAIYTSFAAAQANPQLFTGDTLLGSSRNHNVYKIVHIPAIRALGWLTGDYGKGVVFLLGPLVLIYLLGYYILGRVLFENRFWALILSLTTSVYILTPLDDDVGLIFDALPGFAFGALLPYLLSAIVHFQDDTTKWRIITACCAGLIYVHPVSAPAWVFGLWVFYALSNPDGLALEQRVRRAFALGLVAFLILLPFAASYVGSHDTAPNDPAKVAVIREAINAKIESAFLNPIASIKAFSKWLLTDFHYTYLALLSLPFLLCGRRYRKRATPLIAVVCGVVAFSTLLPCVEYIRTMNSGVPYQTAFIRPLKYIVPVIFLLSTWGLSAFHERISESIKSAFLYSGISVLIGSMFLFYVHRKDPSVVRFVYPTIHAWRHGGLLPEKTKQGLAHVEAIRAIRRFIPPKSKVFAASAFALPVRYAALRPLVYADKDGGVFAFSNYDALLQWYEIYKKVGKIKRDGYSPADVEQTIIPVARELDADYIVVHFGDYFEKVGTNAASREKLLATAGESIHLQGLSNVWSNLHYGLYKLVK